MGVKVHFFPSSLIVNDKKWNLANDGELTMRKSYLEANDVRFTQGEQEIVFSTELDELTDHTTLVAKTEKSKYQRFYTIPFQKSPGLKGVLTGTLKLKKTRSENRSLNTMQQQMMYGWITKPLVK